jgi:hypothetical protein
VQGQELHQLVQAVQVEAEQVVWCLPLQVQQMVQQIQAVVAVVAVIITQPQTKQELMAVLE